MKDHDDVDDDEKAHDAAKSAKLKKRTDVDTIGSKG